MKPKLNLGAGVHPLDGFANLDLENGWRFENGLIGYADGSIAAITVSHALMFVALSEWSFVFAELARVLEPGGVLRITEDATDDRRSSRYGGFRDAVTLTSRSQIRAYMELAGLDVHDVGPGFSHFADASLIQNHHGAPPKVFHVEGVKPDRVARDDQRDRLRG